MTNEEYINQTSSSKSRRQKSTQERLEDKIKQLEKLKKAKKLFKRKSKR